jgi:hypothetical protein
VYRGVPIKRRNKHPSNSEGGAIAVRPSRMER